MLSLFLQPGAAQSLVQVGGAALGLPCVCQWHCTVENDKYKYKLTCWDDCVWLLYKAALTTKKSESSCCSKALLRGNGQRSFMGIYQPLWRCLQFCFAFLRMSVEKDSHWDSNLCSVKVFIQLFDSIRRHEGVRRVVKFRRYLLQQLWKGSSMSTHIVGICPSTDCRQALGVSHWDLCCVNVGVLSALQD